jgi:hypothetical protein
MLPDKLSDLIDVAIADLEKAEQSPDYRIYMSVWHSPGDELFLMPSPEQFKKCYVCFAGSVIAFSLSGDRMTEYSPSCYPADISAKLHALNHVREGRVRYALQGIGAGNHHYKYDRMVVPYEANASEFKNQMRDLANDLARDGL